MDINNVIANKIDNISQSRIGNVKNQTEHISSENVKLGRDLKLTKENTDNLIDTLNSAAKSVNQRVSFSFSDKTNRVIMKFLDGDTNEVVREIPQKEMIRLLEHMHELIGMFVDESR
ncbi:MAG: flagellar protein FlaG [Spirochaetota bacterium]